MPGPPRATGVGIHVVSKDYGSMHGIVDGGTQIYEDVTLYVRSRRPHWGK